MPVRMRDNGSIYWETLRNAERSMIEFYLDNGYNVVQAAEVLGVSAPFLYRRMRKNGMSARIARKIHRKPK